MLIVAAATKAGAMKGGRLGRESVGGAVRRSRPDWERAASNTGLDGRRQGTDRLCGQGTVGCAIWTGYLPGKCSSSDTDRDRRRNGPFMAGGGQFALLGLRAFVQRNAPSSWPGDPCPKAGCGGWSHWLSSRVPLVRQSLQRLGSAGCSCGGAGRRGVRQGHTV